MATSTAFKKGEKRPNQGKRGPNKTTRELKEMILKALDESGGVDYLVQAAHDKPAAFLALLGRVLPMTVEGGDKPVGITVNIKQF